MDPQRNAYTPLGGSARLSESSFWLNNDQRLLKRGLSALDNFHSPPQESTTTLFVGDLAVLCDEGKLFELFYPFGDIDSVQLKKSDRDPLRSHLGFGFVKFKNHENAERALQALNGHFLLGRAMRVGWAEDYGKRQSHSTIEKTIDPKKQRQTAQIHVPFTSRDLTKVVAEVDLGKVFQRFGNLVDIAIKRNVVNEVLQTQSGYAFIHFTLNHEGIQSAITAVEGVNNCVIDNIVYQVKVTHTLQAQILAMANQRVLPQRPHPKGEFETFSKRTVPLLHPVSRSGGNLPSKQLVHSFPNDLSPPPSMIFLAQPIDSFGESRQTSRPFDVSNNRSPTIPESFQVEANSFQAYNSSNVMRQLHIEPGRENRMFNQRIFTMNSNKPTETVYSSYSQASSFEKF